MTKAAHILWLYDGKRSTQEIAEIVGCRQEYVRVVARQRKGSGLSDIDRRYLEKFKDAHGIAVSTAWQNERYRIDPAFREAKRARNKEYYAKNREKMLAYFRAYNRRKKVERIAREGSPCN